MNIAKELIKIAKLLNASTAEKAVEELLHDLLNNESTLTQFKNNIFSVGGFVRDKLWGIDSDDLDLIVNLKSGNGSEKLTKLLFDYFGNNKVSRPIQQRNYPIWKMSFKDNIEYKGKIYNTKGADIDFADPQKESFPDETTRQRETLPGTLQEDAERRDLTINTLMQNLTNKEIVDLTGYGLKDIQEGIVRISPTVNWDKILSDDPIRTLRVVRFFLTKSNLKSLQKDMLFALKRNADRLAIVSPERITKELEKIMKAGKLSEAISLFNITGILPYILPELEILKDTHHDTTRGIHQESSVWNHMLLVLKNAPATIEGQLSALLHDIGKPQTREELTDKVVFYGHEEVGGELTEAILRRLKFDNQTVSKVRNIVEQHMAPHRLQEALESTNNEKNQRTLMRRFIRKLGDDLEDVLAMAEADIKGNLPVRDNYVPELREKLKKIKEETPEVTIKPVLNGFEIMEALNINPKDRKSLPLVGKASKFLLEKQDENPKLTKEEAIKLIKEFKNA